jgi:ABC-type glycerol-3-phosphate transport system permease component
VPLFGPVERRGTHARLVHGTIYVVLTLGAISMVYPFLLMLGASVTTEQDFEDWRIVPAYLTDDLALYRKWMDDRYGLGFITAKRVHRFDESTFRYLQSIPDYGLDTPEVRQRVEDWLDCMAELPQELTGAFYQDIYLTRPVHQKYAAWLREEYGGIEAFNAEFQTAYTRFGEVALFEVTPSHKGRPQIAPLRLEYLRFRATLPREDVCAFVTSHMLQSYVERHIGGVETLNERMGMSYASVYDVLFPTERPVAEGPWRDLWDYYVIRRFPLHMTRVEGDFDEAYRTFLASAHRDHDQRVRKYNAEHGTAFPLLADVTYPPTLPEDDLHYLDWVAFTDEHVPATARRLTTVEGLWRDWLRERHGALEEVNAAHGAQWTQWDEIMPPLAETDVYAFTENKSAIRREFLTRNYRLVLDYMVFHGRAGLNTLILVAMSVLGHLTVQPLAAYGLSRFNLRYSHKILLFLLATMAFPAEVAMIPNFLLIKELGLLNTYWALVLPGLASGMGIFLLKGYFDSLPRELYEAAMMDGASEMRMFLQITIPLSKPILAVIALRSFAAAYGGFMWAFLICQNPKMWTMMVFLWQLGRLNYQSVWMASLVIAAIPTLLVFIFCQKIILRGIIVPTMK